jgi:hypothetical protein
MVVGYWIFFPVILLFLPCQFLFAAYQEKIILTVESGKCSFRVEADDQSRTLRLRILPADSGCYCSREEMQSVLQKAFAKTVEPKLNGHYSSLFIGRLIDYPWLGRYLASTAYGDKMWDRKKGKPFSMDLNKYVGALLSRKNITDPLEAAIAGSGHRITSASVEKVLVGYFHDAPFRQETASREKVPFDAMVWFRLEAQVEQEDR